MYVFQLIADRNRLGVTLGGDDQIQEIVAVEADCRAAVGRTYDKPAETPAQLIKPKPEVVFGVHIAAEAEIDRGHQVALTVESVRQSTLASLDEDTDVARAADRARFVQLDPHPGHIEFVEDNFGDSFSEGLHELE